MCQNCGPCSEVIRGLGFDRNGNVVSEKWEWFLSGDDEATLGLVSAQKHVACAVMPKATWLLGWGKFL
jgi:hypothetical protein